MTDDWDSIVDLERQEYDRGYSSGFHDSIKLTNDSSGYPQGLLKGYAIGFEAGFIEAAANSILQDTSLQGDVALTERGKKKVEEVRKKASLLSNANDTETDYDDEVQSLRSKYRQLGNTYGPCPPKLKGDGQTSKSHDW